MSNLVRRLALFAAVLATLTLTGVAPAQATPIVEGKGVPSACDNIGTDSGVDTAYDSGSTVRISQLPVKRWSAMPTHARLPLEINPLTWGPVIVQNTNATLLGMGNAAWGLTAWATTEAARFCVGGEIGRWIDQAAGAMGKALAGSKNSPGMVAGLVAFAIVGILWRARKYGNVASTLTKLVITVGVLFMFINGAMETTETRFGRGSPGWWGQTVNSAVSAVATAPVEGMNDAVGAIVNNTSKTSTSGNTTHCAKYIATLQDSYESANAAADKVSILAATQAVDAMWLSSGLAIWRDTQFGSNPWAEKAACRMLEFGAHVPPVVHAGHTAKIKGVNNESLAFSPVTNEEIDQALIGWAACKVDASGAISVETAWNEKNAGVTETDCKNFFTVKKAQFAGGGTLNFGDNVSENINRIVDGGVEDYVLSLHGNKSADATGTLIMYVVASWITAVVFIVLAAAVFVAKMGMLVLGLFAIWVLLVGIIKVGDEGSKLADLGKQYVSLSFFAFGASLLLSVVAMLTSVIHSVGVTVSGGDPVSGALWTALAPVAAVVLANMVFTKLLKAPSPFKPTSALGYGAAAGSGNILGGTQGALDRGFRKASGTAKGLGKKAVAGVKSATGKSERSGGMSPMKSIGEAAVAGAAGAKVADMLDDAEDAREETSKSGSTKQARQMAEAHEWARRGGREASDTGNELRDKMADAKAVRQASRDRRRELFASGAGGMVRAGGKAIAKRISGSELAHKFAANPVREGLKMAGAGLVGAAALSWGLPAAAAVATTYAARKAVQARKLRAQFKKEHGGLTRTQFNQRRDELAAYQADMKQRALAAKAERTAEQVAVAGEPGPDGSVQDPLFDDDRSAGSATSSPPTKPMGSKPTVLSERKKTIIHRSNRPGSLQTARLKA